MAGALSISTGPGVLAIALWVTGHFAPALAQTNQCRGDITAADGYRVRSVVVQGRFSPQFSFPIKPGDPYSPPLAGEAVRVVSDALRSDNNQSSPEFQTLGAVSVLFVGSCVKVVDEAKCKDALGQSGQKCVDIVVQPTALRVYPSSIAASLLPSPRSSKPTFMSNVPAGLLALNPTFGMGYDRRFGFSESLGARTNLLDLPGIIKGEAARPGKTRLDLAGRGQKSYNELFYDTASSLSLSRTGSGLLQKFGLDADFAASHRPLGDGDFLRNAVHAGASLTLRPGLAVLRDVKLSGRYQWSSNRRAPEATSESAAEAAALLNGRIGSGVTRLGLWFDAASPRRSAGSYRRAAVLFGYAAEFGNGNQTVGVEAIAGGGRAWGKVPRYARFYGGDSEKDFMYEADDSPDLAALPTGPLLRSFGTGSATAAGSAAPGSAAGASYYHVNLNVTIPVPALSSPLIPDEEVDAGITIKQVLKNQARGGERTLASLYKRQGLSDAQAKAKAERDWRDIGPAVGFIADHANIYALKPLAMFDAARIWAPGGAGSRTRFALGGGLQLTVVVARFEIGYMRTLRRLPGDDRGNLVMRFVVQNIF